MSASFRNSLFSILNSLFSLNSGEVSWWTNPLESTAPSVAVFIDVQNMFYGAKHLYQAKVN